MLSISEYNPFFIKKSFNLSDYKPKFKKRVIIEYDHLFYELFNKMHNYDLTHIDYKTNETQEKIKLSVEIEKMNVTNMNDVINKIKNKDKDEIIQNLMYESKINLKTLNALCLFYKINLLYVKDNIFIKMGCNKDRQLIMYNNKFVETMSNLENNNLDNINSNLMYESKYEVFLDKPLRCASYYKIDELRKISTQLHLPIENIKKQQLYDSIHNILSKLNI
jgi:hypothetical protein